MQLQRRMSRRCSIGARSAAALSPIDGRVLVNISQPPLRTPVIFDQRLLIRPLSRSGTRFVRALATIGRPAAMYSNSLVGEPKNSPPSA